jgi:hypothetical protein
VPGKQNYSLVITWALDHDPVKAVQDIVSRQEAQEGALEQNGGHAMLAQRSINMRKSHSLQDAAKVGFRPERLISKH